MPSSTNSFETTLAVIPLKTSSLKDIVKKKLLYTLNNKKDNEDLLHRFYCPVEKALIKTALEFHKGNQIKAARHLGVNRNTLNKKISSYNLNIKALMLNLTDTSFTGQELFVSSIESLDLTEVAKRKFLFLQEQSRLQETPRLIQKFCQPVEKTIIETVLENFKGHRIKTAKVLGINRNTLKSKIDLYKITLKKGTSHD